MKMICVLIVKILFDMVPCLSAEHSIQSKMTTYEKRVLLFLNAARDLPVDIQREILKYYPPPNLSPRMKEFISRWKARRANA